MTRNMIDGLLIEKFNDLNFNYSYSFLFVGKA